MSDNDWKKTSGWYWSPEAIWQQLCAMMCIEGVMMVLRGLIRRMGYLGEPKDHAEILESNLLERLMAEKPDEELPYPSDAGCRDGWHREIRGATARLFLYCFGWRERESSTYTKHFFRLAQLVMGFYLYRGEPGGLPTSNKNLFYKDDEEKLYMLALKCRTKLPVESAELLYDQGFYKELMRNRIYEAGPRAYNEVMLRVNAATKDWKRPPTTIEGMLKVAEGAEKSYHDDLTDACSYLRVCLASKEGRKVLAEAGAHLETAGEIIDTSDPEIDPKHGIARILALMEWRIRRLTGKRNPRAEEFGIGEDVEIEASFFGMRQPVTTPRKLWEDEKKEKLAEFPQLVLDEFESYQTAELPEYVATLLQVARETEKNGAGIDQLLKAVHAAKQAHWQSLSEDEQRDADLYVSMVVNPPIA